MSSGRLQEIKNNGKSLNVRPKKWSRSLTGGSRLLEVLTARILLGKFCCFELAVAYGRRSHMEVRPYLYIVYSTQQTDPDWSFFSKAL